MGIGLSMWPMSHSALSTAFAATEARIASAIACELSLLNEASDCSVETSALEAARERAEL